MPNATKKAAASTTTAKRKSLTPAERIAKAEAALADLKAKAAEKGTKRIAVIDAKLKVATTKRNTLNGVISALEAEKAALVPADDAESTDSDS